MLTRRSLQRFTIAVAATLVAAVVPITAHADVISLGSVSPSTLTTNPTTTSQIIVGFGVNPGVLEVNASAVGNGFTTVTGNFSGSVGAVAGFGSGGTGSIIVNGNGTAGSATFTTLGSITLGVSGGNGTLNVINGGTVTTTRQDLFSGSPIQAGNSNSTGAITVDGAGSTLSATGRIQIGAFSGSTGSMTVSGGGTAQTTGTIVGQTELEIGTGLNATGTVTVTGAGSSLTAGGVIVGSTNTGSTASLLIQNGGIVTTNQVAPGVGGGLSIGGGTSATVTVTGAGSTLNVGPITAGFLAGKEVIIGGFGNGSLLVDNSATVNAAGANVIVSGGVFGTQTSSPGVLTVRNGASLIANTVTINTNGTLNGDGTITGDVVLSGGTISPGNSPGTLTIDGDLTLNDGTLVIEIESPSVFDILDVSGNIVVGEDVQLNLIFGFGPTGQTFDIEDFFTGFSSLSFDPDFNLFANLNVSGLGAGDFVTFALGDTERTIRQASVPLPSTIALVLIGLAGFGFARWRKQ